MMIVGRVSDGEPLFRSELALARAEPQALLRGLAALAEEHGASEVVLAIRDDYWRHAGAVRDALANALPTPSRALRLPCRYPLNAPSVAADLVEHHGLNAAADAEVFGAAQLVARGRSASTRRLVSVVGYVARPAVIDAPVGTAIEQLVQRCGGALPEGTRGLGWVPLINGAASGWLAAQDDLTDEQTEGVFVAPGRHPLVMRRATPLADIVRRATSACTGCRVCTDICPAYLNGAALQPHRISALIASERGGDDGGLRSASHAAEADAMAIAALSCGGCNLCDAACPADLLPSRLVAALARGLAQRGVAPAGPRPFDIAPRAGRAARRYSLERLRARLGIAALSAPDPTPQPLR